MYLLKLTVALAVSGIILERRVSALYSIGGFVNTMGPDVATSNVALYDNGKFCYNQPENATGFTTWSSAPRLACNTIVDHVSWTPNDSSPVSCNYRVVNANRYSPQSIVLEAILVVENEGSQACVYHQANGVGFNLPVFSTIDWATSCGSTNESTTDVKARQRARVAKKIARQARGGLSTASSGFTVINLLPVDATLTVTAFAPSGGPDLTTPAPTPCAGPIQVSTASNSYFGVRPFGNGACMGTPASTYLLSAGLNDAGSGSASGVLGTCTVTIGDDGSSVFHSLSLLVSSLGVDGPLCVSAALAQEVQQGAVSFSCPPC